MVPIDMTMRATVTGRGAATAVLDGARLVVSGTFSGMQGPATLAQLHIGTKTGVRGPAIHDLEIDHAAAGALSGEIELSAEQIESLRNGRFYVQIHSQSAPDGSLWGWFLR
jgi:CHRD domain